MSNLIERALARGVEGLSNIVVNGGARLINLKEDIFAPESPIHQFSPFSTTDYYIASGFGGRHGIDKTDLKKAVEKSTLAEGVTVYPIGADFEKKKPKKPFVVVGLLTRDRTQDISNSLRAGADDVLVLDYDEELQPYLRPAE